MTDALLCYRKKLIPLSREQLVACVATQLSSKRMGHVLRVEAEALALAKRYGADMERVSIAALLHDYAREWPRETLLKSIEPAGLSAELYDYDVEVLHGVVGWYVIQQQFQIEDPTILRSIRYHTIGAIRPSIVEKIVFVADYIEPQRTFPGVEQARALAYQDIDAAVRFKIVQTMAYLTAQQQPLYSEAVAAYNYQILQKEA